MTARLLTIALPLALVAAPDLAFAQRSHRGGGSGGGHRGGGGAYAVPRSTGGGRPSSPAMRPPSSGSPARYRHPRAGSGSGYGYYRSPYGGHYGGHYGYGYRPYYGGYYGGYYYRPWYGPSFYGSLSWGWPYGYGAGPYAYAPYAYAPAERTVVVYGEGAGAPVDDGAADPAAAGRTPVRGPSGELRLEVRPEDASVYVDDAFRGTAREARTLQLAPGRHTVEIVRPGFAVERREVLVLEGERADLFVELRQR